uniref:Uncharacterized protein n=1 Tax=Anopheles farauti TaxID=69004 RepID=A0A182QJT5_9DIPT
MYASKRYVPIALCFDSRLDRATRSRSYMKRQLLRPTAHTRSSPNPKLKPTGSCDSAVERYCGGQRTTVEVASSSNVLSIGIRSSYSVGACSMIPAVPANTAIRTFVESSSIFVCSAMKRTQKQLRCTSVEQTACEKAGCLNAGLLMPDGTAVSAAVDIDSSSDSEWGSWIGPCIWQLPPNGPVPDKLGNGNGKKEPLSAFCLVWPSVRDTDRCV